MKKNLKLIFQILFLSFFIFNGYQIIAKINHKKDVAQKIKNIPEFSFNDIEGKLFTNENLKANTAIIFVYFNSECEFCNLETEMIKKNTDKFKNVQLIFISLEKPEIIKKFAQTYELLNHDNIHFVYDKQANFATTFDVAALPTILIYNSQKQLIEKTKGQVKIDYLLQKIK